MILDLNSECLYAEHANSDLAPPLNPAIEPTTLCKPAKHYQKSSDSKIEVIFS